jgi:hypothetical protein
MRVSIGEKAIKIIHWVLLPENIWALLLCLIILAVVILTADTAPLWIYQGF